MKPYGYVRADGKGLFIYGDHQFTNNQNHDLIPVYTHPKEWVGLTEDDIAQAMYRADAIITGPMQFRFAEELEAKLKEKNNA
jgi:hypothetical protein